MKLRIQKYVEDRLAKATYVFDKSVGQWAAWVESVPGALAQADTLEEVRSDLGEAIELLYELSLRESPLKKQKKIAIQHRIVTHHRHAKEFATA